MTRTQPYQGVLFALLVLIAPPGCKKEEAVEVAEGPRPIKIHRLGGQGAGAQRDYPGRVQSTKTVELSFEVTGRIIDWGVEEGQRVKKGQVLARIDPTDYKAQLDAARARLRLTEAEYQRESKLFASGSSTQRDLDVAVRQRDVNRADVRISRKALEDTKLKALFDGVVARKLITDFRNVQAREPVLLLQDDSVLEVVVDIPEGDLAQRRKKGLDRDKWNKAAKPMVELAALSGRQFPAKLKEFATAADPNTRTYRATFSMKRPKDVNVLAGMTAKMTFTGLTSVRDEELLIPAQSVVSDQDGKPFVWVIDGETMAASKRPVQVGAMTGSLIEVRSGLKSGDAVAMTGVHKLTDGMVVREMEISDETRR